jgi:hypothetical protein
LRLKAARGELHTTVAIGYRRGADDRLEQDPDLRVCEALFVQWSLPRYNTVHRLLTKSMSAPMFSGAPAPGFGSRVGAT